MNFKERLIHFLLGHTWSGTNNKCDFCEALAP